MQLSLVATDGEEVLLPVLVSDEVSTEAPRLADQNLVHDRYARYAHRTPTMEQITL